MQSIGLFLLLQTTVTFGDVTPTSYIFKEDSNFSALVQWILAKGQLHLWLWLWLGRASDVEKQLSERFAAMK